MRFCLSSVQAQMQGPDHAAAAAAAADLSGKAPKSLSYTKFLPVTHFSPILSSSFILDPEH